MNRRRGGSLAGSPLLIGAVTMLIVVVAVYLSYNANNGLPFVPTYKIKVVLPTTSGLQASNEVRMAGTRVGELTFREYHPGTRCSIEKWPWPSVMTRSTPARRITSGHQCG